MYQSVNFVIKIYDIANNKLNIGIQIIQLRKTHFYFFTLSSIFMVLPTNTLFLLHLNMASYNCDHVSSVLNSLEQQEKEN